MVKRYLYSEEVVAKVFNELAVRYENRNGGYTRILKKGYRKGDAASVVQFSLVYHKDLTFEKKKDKKGDKKASKKAQGVKREAKKEAKVKKSKGVGDVKNTVRKAMNSNKSV